MPYVVSGQTPWCACVSLHYRIRTCVCHQWSSCRVRSDAIAHVPFFSFHFAQIQTAWQWMCSNPSTSSATLISLSRCCYNTTERRLLVNIHLLKVGADGLEGWIRLCESPASQPSSRQPLCARNSEVAWNKEHKGVRAIWGRPHKSTV